MYVSIIMPSATSVSIMSSLFTIVLINDLSKGYW